MNEAVTTTLTKGVTVRDTITKAWRVCQAPNGCTIEDAAFAARARRISPFNITDGPIAIDRRRDLDGLTERAAYRAVWPCKEDPCPGCDCCENGVCRDAS